jgi:hypothetical protein
MMFLALGAFAPGADAFLSHLFLLVLSCSNDMYKVPAKAEDPAFDSVDIWGIL